jgi:hypothetical protein
VIRSMQGVALLAICGAICLFVHTLNGWSRPEPKADAVLAIPGAVERFARRQENSPAGPVGAVPLVVQAQALASYLAPAAPEPIRAERPASRPPVPPRPVTARTQFRLCATSYYPSQADRSMALIRESQGRPGPARWVREGSQFGHFVVHEIRQGSIVCRHGDQLVEMSVESRSGATRFVRGHIPGRLQADSAQPKELLDGDGESVAR